MTTAYVTIYFKRKDIEDAYNDADKLKEVGFDNHLTKPFKIDVIREAIQAGFEEFRRRTEIRDKTS